MKCEECGRFAKTLSHDIDVRDYLCEDCKEERKKFEAQFFADEGIPLSELKRCR
jgi:hypothetical protein